MEQRTEPELTQTDPKAYFLWLRAQGLNPVDAATQVQQRFGKPKSPEEIARDNAKAQEAAGLAQAAGGVGGAFIASEAMRGFPNIGGLFSSGGASGATGATAVPGAVPVPPLAGGEAALGAQTGSSTLGSIGSYALPVAVGAALINNAWETGMKDIVRGKGDRADWANQAANMTGIGGIANIGLRLMGKRSIGAMMKSGKSAPQQIRDDFRGDLKEAGVVDDNYHVTLADGSKFNVGLDGKTKYTNADGKTKRNAWDGDSSNPLSNFATQQLDPMIRNIYGADNAKSKYFPSQFTGMLVNAAISNAKNEQDVLSNIKSIIGTSKFAEAAGVGVKPPPPPKAPKGEVIRVSPGMYVNDKGHVGPAKTVSEALRANYKSKSKNK